MPLKLFSFSPIISSISSHLRFCSPKILRDLQLQPHSTSKATFSPIELLPPTSCFPITSQRLSSPSKTSPLQRISSQRRLHQEEEPQRAPAASHPTHLPRNLRDTAFLTPSRKKGFLRIHKLMQHMAMQLHAQGGDPVVDGAAEEKGSTLGGTGDDGSSNGSTIMEVLDGKEGNLEVDGSGGGTGSVISFADGAPSNSTNISGGRAARIRGKLERELCPVELQLEDVSYQHAGHAGVRGNNNGETHFNVRIVSKEFEGKSLVKRHRLVYELLQDELQTGLHALSIVAKTPSEVAKG